MLSRLPISRVTYTRLPTRQSRGFLQAELGINGSRQVVCCIHLDSGKSSSRLRSWQLRRIFGALRTAEDAVLLGDFNMRDAENSRIAAPYCDVWPAMRPDDDGFTEDTTINLMRYDMKNKHRHVRFDRVLVKGSRWAAAEIELLGTEPISSRPSAGFPVGSLRREMPSYTPKSIGRPAGPTADCRRRRWRRRCHPDGCRRRSPHR